MLLYPNSKWPSITLMLHSDTIRDKLSICPHSLVVRTVPFCETPLLWHKDLQPEPISHLIRQWYKSMWPTFCRPGNLNFALRSASLALASLLGFVRTEIMDWPMRTRATVPQGFPNAPLIPVWSLTTKPTQNFTPFEQCQRCHPGYSQWLHFHWSQKFRISMLYIATHFRKSSQLFN